MREFVQMKQLIKIVQLSESCIRRWMKLGLFPNSVPFSGGRKGWCLDEVRSWMTEKSEEIRKEMKRRHFGDHNKKIDDDLPW